MVVQMGGVSSVDGAVWRCRKVRRRGKGRKSLPTATTTASSNTFWPTATNELEAWACRYYWCWRTFCESHVLFGRDGPLVFACYEKLSAFSQFCQAPCFPNVRAIATAITEEDPCQNVTALERSAKACVEPAIRWFLRKFNVDLYDVVVAFKAARPFCPVTIQWLKPTNALVESLRAFPFLDSDTTIDGLKAELPAYLAAAEDVVTRLKRRKSNDGVSTRSNFLVGLPQWSKFSLSNHRLLRQTVFQYWRRPSTSNRIVLLLTTSKPASCHSTTSAKDFEH